jgi:uncharacterized protein YeaO (DUF488 family)
VRQLVRDVRASRAYEVWMPTLTPSSALGAGSQAALAGYDDMVRRVFPGVDKVIEAQQTLWDPGNHNQLLPAYAAAGAIHLTAAGWAALLGVIPFVPSP